MLSSTLIQTTHGVSYPFVGPTRIKQDKLGDSVEPVEKQEHERRQGDAGSMKSGPVPKAVDLRLLP